ncbi:MAG TPA: HAMP domain-containing sensor histidine kinase [Ignavibacteria bacterium]|nr:HAMP domain-containing sensor histidine kinase [Ignavibacteria bacterium]
MSIENVKKHVKFLNIFILFITALIILISIYVWNEIEKTEDVLILEKGKFHNVYLLGKLQTSLIDIRMSNINYFYSKNEVFLRKFDSVNTVINNILSELKEKNSNNTDDLIIIKEIKSKIDEHYSDLNFINSNVNNNIRIDSIYRNISTNLINTKDLIEDYLNAENTEIIKLYDSYTIFKNKENSITILFIILFILLIILFYYQNNYLNKIRSYEVRLENQNKKLNSVIYGNLDAIYVLTVVKSKTNGIIDFKISDVNLKACEQVKLKRNELIDKNVNELLKISNANDFVNICKSVFENQTAHEREYSLKNENDSTVWFQQQIIPTSDGVIVFNRNITKRKLEKEKIISLNKQLNELNINKDELISILAHDLRSPVSGISELLNLILEDYDTISDEELKDYIKTASKTSSEAFNLLENLLEWTRIKTGKKQFEPVIFDVKPEINKVVDLFEINLMNKKIHLINKSGKHYVNADKNSFNTILRNLISNAVKFTGVNGEISIETFEKDKNLFISVKDSGTGISSDKISLLFSNEIKSTLGTNNEKGTGYGLLICKELIEKSGGQLYVESKPNEGSIFKFSLPIFVINQK